MGEVKYIAIVYYLISINYSNVSISGLFQDDKYKLYL